MDRKVSFKVILLFSWICSSMETVLLVKKNKNIFNNTCMGNATLTWIGRLEEDISNIKMETDFYKGTSFKFRKSFDFNLPPVLDWRWNDFSIYPLKCGKSTTILGNTNNIRVLTLSIRFKDWVTIELRDNNGLWFANLRDSFELTTFVKHKYPFNCNNLTNEVPWRHYNIYYNDGRYHISKNSPLHIQKYNIGYLAIVPGTSSTEVKIHNYSVTETANFFSRNEIKSCVSVFFYTLNACRIIINNQLFNTNYRKEWEERQFVTNHVNFSSNCLAKVELRNCPQNGIWNEISLLSVDTAICQNIREEFTLVVKQPTAQKYNDGFCQNPKYLDLCENRLICEKSSCYCLPHFDGNFCEDEKSSTLCQNGVRGSRCQRECSKESGHCENGCVTGYYGMSCSDECPQNCKDRKCYIETGICTSGCINQFQGPKCQDCLVGYFGTGCRSNCAEGCKEKMCERDSGQCSNGCSIGYNGSDCKKCEDNRWGENCSETCGKGCSNACDTVTGNCDCREGYAIEGNCEEYTHLHEDLRLLSIGPDCISFTVNTSEITSNMSVQFFEKGKKLTVMKENQIYKIANLTIGTTFDIDAVVCNVTYCYNNPMTNRKITGRTCKELVPDALKIDTTSNMIKIAINSTEYCRLQHYKIIQVNTTNLPASENFMELENLEPFSIYVIEFKRKEKLIFNIKERTRESAPGAPENLMSSDEDETLIKWSPPQKPNGILVKFNIFVNDKYCGEVLYNEGGNIYTYKLQNVAQASTYNITVQAVNSLVGEKAHLEIYTKPSAPKITRVIRANHTESYYDLRILLENNSNSTIYEINGTRVMKACENITTYMQKKELMGSNEAVLSRVNVDSIICAQNNFYGKISYAAATVPGMPAIKNAKFYYLFLILIPISLILFIMVYRIKRSTNYTATLREKDQRAQSYSLITPIILPEIKPEINRNQLGRYLQNIISEEGGPVNLDMEYQQLCKQNNETNDTLVGRFECNRMKNRYNNVLPYDKTRVILRESTEDYINANYIEGRHGAKTYIATQCPKLITENDFWQMIWQEEVSIIVILSTLSEGLEKMSQYWPNDYSVKTCRKLTVAHVETERHTDFVIRTFLISLDNTERRVKQVNYITWPDGNIPLFPLSLLEFVKYIQGINRENKAPIVVHCSAGIGRTGVYIMCDHYLNSNEQTVNVPKLLELLRTCRPSLVQTKLQYRLIYFILDEIINEIEQKNMTLDEIGVLNKNTIKKYVSSDVEYLAKRNYMNKLLYCNTKPVGGKPEANRNPRIKAVSETTIILPPLKGDDYSTYVNAVYVHGYQCKNKYISTQLPLPGTLREFWRLAFDQRVQTILSLQDIKSKDQSIFKFWPKEGEILMASDTLEIFCENTHDEEFFVIYDLRITNIKNLQKEINTRLVVFSAWSCDKQTPNSIESFLALYNSVSKLTLSTSKTMLCCYDSAVGCGLYIICDLLLNKIKYDKIFNICWAVRSIRRFRSDFMSNKDQFVFLYEVASYFVNNQLSDIHDYANEHLKSDIIEEFYENVFENFNSIKF